jgi:outer membrane protein OmpA-like peptidoglycan-associated protein
MKTVLVTLAIVAASLSLISTATPDSTDTEPTADAAGTQAQAAGSDPQQSQQAPSAPMEPLPAQLEQLRSALNNNREELQWVQDLLQQAGETLYWAQTRHHQSVMMQQALEDQLAATAAAYADRQAQLTELAGELTAVKASLSEQQWESSNTQAQMRALVEERDQLRRALAERDQQLAEMDKALKTARADLQQARAEKVAVSRQASGGDSRYQACQSQHAALNDELAELRRSETDARQSLVKANAERYRLRTDLATCSTNLVQARASFASMEAATEPPATTPFEAAPIAPPAPAATTGGEAASGQQDGEADTQTDSPVSLQGVKFRYDSSELTDESRAILDEVAVLLRKQPHTRHEVAGHTDSQGDPGYNLRLSQRRAEKVRQYLIARGVDAGKLKARGYGGLQPIADNSTWAGLVSNRRVELRAIR